MKLVKAGFLIAMLGLSCANPPASPASADSSACEVYRFLLSDLVKGDSLRVVEETTVCDTIRSWWVVKAFRNFLGESECLKLIDEYDRLNTKPVKLTSCFDQNSLIHLISRAEIDTLDPMQWPVFYERYPRSYGIIEFTRIAYSSDSLWALVSTYHWRGPLQGQAHLKLLRREPSGWKLVASEKTIES